MSATDMVPGSSTEGVVTIRNSGTATGVLTFASSGLGDTPGPNGGALSTILELSITDVTDGSDADVYTGTVAAMRTAGPVTLVPGDARTFRFRAALPDTVDNAFFDSSTTVGFRWVLTSAKNRACFSKMSGGKGDNRLMGTKAGDSVHGLEGNDVISARAGDDCAWGEAGNDKLSGSTGRDRLDGGTGHDRISGGSGDDTIYARDNTSDSIDCGAGNDTAYVDRRDLVKHCEVVKRH
jgi:Ca2+-binding RTX toxin-like protein